MNKIAGVLLLVSFGLLTSGATLIAPAAGLLTAGVLIGVTGVMSLSARPRREKEPR